jgi:class 3 adenylate cyclase/CHASE2 domain-containing sensor protein
VSSLTRAAKGVRWDKLSILLILISSVVGTLLVKMFPFLGYIDLEISPTCRTSEEVAKVVLITIRRESFDNLGTDAVAGTLPRRYHAKLLDNLAKAGPKSVLFDLKFTDSSPDDFKLSNAIQSAQTIPIVLLVEPESLEAMSFDSFSFHVLRPSVLPILRPQNVRLAHPLAWDPDGIIRGVKLVVEDKSNPGLLYPHAALAAILSPGQEILPTQSGITDGKRRWATGPNFEMIVRWKSPFREIEFSDAMDMLENGDFDTFKQAIVIVGTTLQGQRLDDAHPTPLGTMSGSQTVAQAINSLSLRESAQPRFAPSYTAPLISLILAAVSVVCALKPTWKRVLFATSIPTILAFFLSFGALELFSTHVGVLQLGLPAMIACTAILGRKVVAQLPVWEKFGWAGKQDRICAVFVDICNSTKIMEQAVEADQLFVRVQNIITNAVERNGGHIERAIGDGAFAVFRNGTQEDRALSALRSVLLAHEQVDLHSPDFMTKHGFRVELGFGFEMAEVRGEVLRSKGRAEFSSFGLGIAFAARLESLSRSYESKIAAGPEVVALLKGRTETKFLKHTVDVKGFGTDRDIYELVLG